MQEAAEEFLPHLISPMLDDLTIIRSQNNQTMNQMLIVNSNPIPPVFKKGLKSVESSECADIQPLSFYIHTVFHSIFQIPQNYLTQVWP
jgi:hypothetical protein